MLSKILPVATKCPFLDADNSIFCLVINCPFSPDFCVTSSAVGTADIMIKMCFPNFATVRQQIKATKKKIKRMMHMQISIFFFPSCNRAISTNPWFQCQYIICSLTLYIGQSIHAYMFAYVYSLSELFCSSAWHNQQSVHSCSSL